MKTLFLFVGGACDMSCAYCYYTSGYEKRPTHHIHAEMIDLIAERIGATGFGQVILTGGDPLCEQYKQNSFELVAKLKDAGMRVVISTSAASLDDDDLDEIVDLHVDRLCISIDSHQDHIHNAQRAHHGRTVRAIRSLLDRGYPCISTTTVVTQENAASLKDTLDWLRDMGIRHYRVQCAFLPREDKKSEAIISSMNDCLLALLEVSSHALSYLKLNEDVFSGKTPTWGRCQMGSKYFVCDPEGTLYPCFHCLDYPLGNLFYDHLEAIVEAMETNHLATQQKPACLGKQCVSLFDSPDFWDM
jgi:MoaA/NifB/PqqE/SkfB family radical SAM enzyme